MGRALIGGADSSGSLAMLAAMRRASSRVSSLAAARLLGQKQVSASGRVVVSDLEGFVLFFEQTGQLLDSPSTAGQVGR